MKKLFNVFLAGILILSISLSTSAFASGELNLCGSYAQVATNGSILSYADGSFSSDGTYVTDKVSSGFCSVNTGSGETTDATGSVLTYPTGVGGRAADDRSVKLTSITSDVALSVGELNDSGNLTNSYFSTSGIGTTFVIDFSFFAQGSAERRVEFKFGNSNNCKMTLYFNADGTLKRMYRKPGKTTAETETIEGASYEMGKWHRVRIVRDLSDSDVSGQTYKANKDYIFLDGKKILESDVYETQLSLTYVTFKQNEGTDASLCIDDAEFYVAASLEAALSTEKHIVELIGNGVDCVVNSASDTIVYSSAHSPVTIENLKASITGNVSGIYRNASLITSGNLNDGDTIIARSADGRTFRYYTLDLNINLPNLVSDVSVISGISYKKDNSTVDWVNNGKALLMFDNKKDTFLSAASQNLTGEFVIDFGENNSKEFNRVSIYKPSENPKAFKLTVQVSDDNHNWTDALKDWDTPNQEEIVLSCDFPKISARYVKFIIYEAAGFAISEIGLYYDASNPITTSYKCIISKNTNTAKLNARTEASVAIGDSLSGVLISAVYGSDDSLIEARLIDDNFSVSENSEFSHTYEINFAQGAKYAKVFFWNDMLELVPVYGCCEYRE